MAKQRSRRGRVAMLHVGGFSSPDVENLWAWQPTDLGEIFFLLEFTIGPAEEAGNLFSVVVCTPEALRRRAVREIAIIDRAALVVTQYDWKAIRAHIEQTVESLGEVEWSNAVPLLERFFLWEYESR